MWVLVLRMLVPRLAPTAFPAGVYVHVGSAYGAGGLGSRPLICGS